MPESMDLRITMYTTSWCGDCRRLKAELHRAGVSFREIDIEQEQSAAEFVKRVNDGNLSVPTLVFSDGSTMTEPSSRSVIQRLAELA
ncbi:MAG: mycoredoxin [Candidatus Nanopelagicales bacterium]|nr:mycoredoxin [Candidatus Nanopelagicales bacterium]